MKTTSLEKSRNGLLRRAGVVLIVILGMLAALALLGIAFTTFSAQEERSSKNYSTAFATPRADQNPEALFIEILSQIVADTKNLLASLESHSLLLDMYGVNNDMGPGVEG